MKRISYSLLKEVAVIFLITIFVVTCTMAFYYGVGFLGVQTMNGQTYDVTVTVQAVEHSTRWGDHTNVWAQVYGDQDITYTLIGNHALRIGDTYHIVFINRIQWNYWDGFYVWGEVQTLEEIGK